MRDVLAGQDEIRGSAANQNSALDGALTPWGVPIPGRSRFVISSLNLGAFVDRAALHQAGRAMWHSLLLSKAQAIRAVLLASATATIFGRFRASNCAAQLLVAFCLRE